MKNEWNERDENRNEKENERNEKKINQRTYPFC